MLGGLPPPPGKMACRDDSGNIRSVHQAEADRIIATHAAEGLAVARVSMMRAAVRGSAASPPRSRPVIK